MLTREDAIRIAQNHAFQHRAEHSYLPALASEARNFVPHEWVIAAILFAANGNP